MVKKNNYLDSTPNNWYIMQMTNYWSEQPNVC